MNEVRQQNGLAANLQLPAARRRTLPATLSPAESIAVATESVTDVITAARMQIEKVISDVSSTLKECDGELNATEKINIIFEEGRTVFSIERSVRLGQERSRF